MRYELTGLSTPVGGVSWTKNVTGKELFTRLFLYLESKRILINPIEMENKEWCIESVLEIKSNLVSMTEGVTLSEFDLQVLRKLIASCNQYLDSVSPLKLNTIIYKKDDRWEDLSFDHAMKTFRNGFRSEINSIEKKYQLHFQKEIPEEF